jgi:SAM-dependent methyltransferase
VDGVPVLISREAGGVEGTGSVAELYDDVAENYDQVFAAHVVEHYLNRRTDLVRRHLSAGSVLDIGCGTGILADRIARHGFDVAGIDLSPNMLAKARERGFAHTFAALSTALPFEDETFDLAITVATLHHLETPPRVAGTIAEMARVVRRGGIVVLWDHNPLNPYWPWLMSRVPQDSGDERLVGLEEILEDVKATELDPTAGPHAGLHAKLLGPGLATCRGRRGGDPRPESPGRPQRRGGKKRLTPSTERGH